MKARYTLSREPFAAGVIDILACLLQQWSWKIFEWNNKRRARAINKQIKKSR